MVEATLVEKEELMKKLSEAVEESRTRSEGDRKDLGETKEALEKSNKEIGDLSQKISDLQTESKGRESMADQVKKLEEQQAIMAASVGTKKSDKEDKGPSEEMKHFNGMLRNKLLYDKYNEHQVKVAKSIVSKQFVYANPEQAEFLCKDLLVGSGPDGGFLVPPEFGAMITGRIFETSPMRGLAEVISTNSSDIEFPLDDQEADTDWVGEVQSRPVTGTPQFGKIVIPAHELFSQPKATQKLLDDAGINVESWLAGKVARRMSRKENEAFVIGDGSLKPRGILNYGAWASPGVYQRDAIERINSGVANNIEADSFKIIMGSLVPDYLANASWAMNRDVWTIVTLFKGSGGEYLFDPMRSFKDGDMLQILGKPVSLFTDMVKTVSNNDLVVIFGDFREGYTIADRIGIRLLRDPFTAKPNILFYTTKRVGGAVTNYEALKIMIVNS